MKVLVSCGTKFHSDHLAYELQQRNSLYKVITSHPSGAYQRKPLDRKKILFLPPIFVISLVLSKLLGKFYVFRSRLEWVLAIIYDWMASLFVQSPDISISWAWTSLRTIREVKKRGGIAIVEECGSCNMYQEKLLQEEYQNLNVHYKPQTFYKIITRELEECQEADYILCPSQYVANSLKQCGIAQEKLLIIPYGVELSLFNPAQKKDDIFRVVFVGTVGIRKGLIYLFKALEQLANQNNLKNFECLIIGRLDYDFKHIFSKYQHYFKYIPRVPHHQLKEYYSNASLFVFPSLDEGMAYVQLEAMACGLPVICTPNSGGDSVIRNGEEGFIIPIRDSDAIQQKIEYLYFHPQELQKMSQKALDRAKEFTWENYGIRLDKKLRELKSKREKC